MGVADQYKQWIAQTFDAAADDFGVAGPDFFGYCGRRLVEGAHLHSGMAILDVACGRGSSLLPALDVVGIDGSLTGIDISSRMVDLLNTELDQQGIDRARAEVMDAEELSFADESFDGAICGLALFFIPNINRAMAEVYRVLRPQGVFAASTFVETSNPWDDEFEKISKEFENRLAPIPKAEVARFDSQEAAASLFESAGLSGIKQQVYYHSFVFRDFDDYWNWMGSHGGRGFLNRFQPEDQKVFREEVARRADEWTIHQPLEYPIKLLVTRGRKVS